MSGRAIAIHGLKLSGERTWKKRASAQLCHIDKVPTLSNIYIYIKIECTTMPRRCHMTEKSGSNLHKFGFTLAPYFNNPSPITNAVVYEGGCNAPSAPFTLALVYRYR